MKTNLLILASMAACLIPLRSQVIVWQPAASLQGDSDVSTTGTFVDAVQAYAGTNVQGSGHGPSPIKIGDTTFNVATGSDRTFGDEKISYTTGGNALFYNANPNSDSNGQHSEFPTGSNASEDYSTLVSNGAYFNSGPIGSINIKDLTPGNYYQVQIFGFVQDGAKSLTSFSDESGNEAVLNAARNVPRSGKLTAELPYGESVIGTFHASAPTAEIDWAAGDSSPYPLFSALALRDVTNVPGVQAGIDQAEAAGKAEQDGTAPAPPPIDSPPGFNNVDVWKNITYAKVGKHRLKLDIYVPHGGSRPLPLVVYIHGGGWCSLDKTEGFANFLLDHGYALACIDYRFSQEALFPAQIYDCKAAIRWLRAHAGQYPYKGDKIGVIGDSAGGHLVAMLGVTNDNPVFEGDEGNAGVSSSVQAVCDYFGPTNFLTIDPSIADHAIPRLIGGMPADIPDKAKAASPSTYVSAKAAPFVIVQGEKDNTVAPQQSIDFNDALQKAGVDSQLRIIPGAGHGCNDGAAIDMDVALFNKYIR